MLNETFRPIVVCLCGSTRFKTVFEEANERETFAGKVVLSVGFFAGVLGDAERRAKLTPAVKRALDELHVAKIEMADEVLVLNVGGYLGASTRREVWYAHRRGKTIRWLEPLTSVDEGAGRLLNDREASALIDSWFSSWDEWTRAAEAALA